MSIVKDMPCHITAMGDAPDTMSDREISAEDEAIREIADALIDGDKYRIYGTYDVDFATIVEDELASSLVFANALRKILDRGSFFPLEDGSLEIWKELNEVIIDAVRVQARLIYEQKGE